jgi:hypothetical protein
VLSETSPKSLLPVHCTGVAVGVVEPMTEAVAEVVADVDCAFPTNDYYCVVSKNQLSF